MRKARSALILRSFVKVERSVVRKGGSALILRAFVKVCLLLCS